MTNAELAALPVGSIIHCGEDEGEIISTGATVEIIWPSLNRTSYVDVKSENWHSLVCYFEEEES